MTKTPMQEWSEWLLAYEYELPLELQVKAKELIKLEEESMKDVFDYGMITGLRMAQGKSVKYKTADEWFKGEYKQ